MSGIASRAAWAAIAERPMSMPARLVLLALSHCHNQETGRCDPSLKMLCAKTQLSERAVRGALRELEAMKQIQTIFRKKTTGLGIANMTSRYKLRGGAQYAGGVGHNMPPNLKITPSAFSDLAMILDDDG